MIVGSFNLKKPMSTAARGARLLNFAGSALFHEIDKSRPRIPQSLEQSRVFRTVSAETAGNRCVHQTDSIPDSVLN